MGTTKEVKLHGKTAAEWAAEAAAFTAPEPQEYRPDAIERARSYGVRMDEALDSAAIKEMRESVDHGITVDLADPNLVRVLRLRLIGYHSREYPRWDISYCYGELKDGTRCRVLLPMHNLGKYWRNELITWGRRENVYVKGLGILEDEVCSRLYG